MCASSSASDARVVAVDIGTQTSRAALVDGDGRIRDMVTTPLSLRTESGGLAEQRPHEWWDATIRNISTLLARHRDEQVLAVAVGAAMHSVVPIDEHGAALDDCVGIWSDKRGADLVEELSARSDHRDLARSAGNLPAAAWSGIKIGWYRNHRPDIYERAATFLVAKDFVNQCLTGISATDPTEASGSFLMDATTGRWSDRLTEAASVDVDRLPHIAASSTEVIGGVTAAAAAVTGLAKGTPVVAGAGDMLCQLAASGLDRSGRVTEISGTASIIAAWSSQPHPDARVMNLRAAGNGWVHFGIADAGGMSMRWFADQVLGEEWFAAQASADRTSQAAAGGASGSRYELVTALADTAPPGCSGLTFLPYLLGERTFGSAHSRGAFIGLTPGHTRAEISRAVLEGITFDLRMALDAIGPDADSAVRVTGGGAESRMWNQLRADIYKRRVETLATSEGGVVGAAMLGLVGAGLYGSLAEATDAVVLAGDATYCPGEDSSDYDGAYDRFGRMHDALVPVWGS